MLLFVTCGRLAVPPVKVSGVDAGFQGAGDRVGPSLDVGLEQLPVQIPHQVHAHLQEQKIQVFVVWMC